MDYETLIVKNIPKNLKLNEYFKNNFKAIAARYYGRARAVVRFGNENDARTALIKIHQSEINKNIVSAEYLGKRDLIKANDNQQNQNKVTNTEVSSFIKNLLSISASHGFNDPPKPNLKYSYPKINRDILDSISIALLSNSKFYTQVLHLMNRMNLDPPFLERKDSKVLPGELKNVQTQTYFEKEENLLASDESELELSEDDEPKRKRLKIDSSNKKLILKTKIKNVIKSQMLTKSRTFKNKNNPEDRKALFDILSKNVQKRHINLNLAAVRIPTKETKLAYDENNSEIETFRVSNSDEIVKKQEINCNYIEENRIPLNQLMEMPIYKNYQKGEVTNKLYIKNLAKEVTLDDLSSIYKNFVSDVKRDLEIKLMQHGRMKGQAFVTFLNYNEKEYDFITNALNLTNGFILKKKPMIVCFGKKNK